MEPFADILRAMRVTGGIFLDAEFTAPWCVSAGIGPDDCGKFVPVPASVVAFHYVSAGRLLVEVDGEAPVAVEQGEIVLLPRNDDHRLGSETGLPPVRAESLIRPGEDGRLAHIEHGGGGAPTRIVCGFLGTGRQQDPVLVMLPRMLKLRIGDAASAAWMESSFRFAAQEMAIGQVSSTDTLCRLAELLFTETVRRYLAELPEDRAGWREGIRDPKIAQALGLLHGQLSRRWTVAELSRATAMSRSAFTERFTRLMGEPPMRYLARQRLFAAAQRLAESKDPIAQVAFAVGYESEAAFNRAFRREYQMPPATWRRSRVRQGSPEILR